MKTMDLVAPAGSLLALKTAINKGADAVYLGLRNATNARNFGGLNFKVKPTFAVASSLHINTANRFVCHQYIPKPVMPTNGVQRSILRCCTVQMQ